jgi:NADH-quinone oxidoreductase subunit D
MGIEIMLRCRSSHAPFEYPASRITYLHRRLADGAGAMTAFLYLVMIRDYVYEHLAAPPAPASSHLRPDRWARARPARRLARAARRVLTQYEEFIGRIHGLMDRNRIFIDRTRNIA